MIVHFDSTTGDAMSVPDRLRRYVSQTSSGLRIDGDHTASVDVYVWLSGTQAAVGTNLAALIEDRLGSGHTFELNDFGISAVLHSGLVPLPHTVYRDVYRLSAGDWMEITSKGGRLSHTFGLEYPWIERLSRGDETADEHRLLALLTAATERQLAPVGNEGFLMLSSGKDSPGVALALAEGGFTGVRCVTFRSGDGDSEAPIAASICRRLGLDHQIVDIPTDPDVIARQLTTFFERAPVPGVDLSQIPYICATMSVDDPQGAVLDGGGNDSYMNYLRPPHARRKHRYRVRPRPVARAVRRVSPIESPFNYLTRSRTEIGFSGRLPRQRHVDRLYGPSHDVAGWWESLSSATASMDAADEFDVVLRRHVHPAQMLLKQKLAAEAIGVDALLPWCDDDVADYYFNLPQADRYKGGTRRKDKLLLRRMLLTYLDYDADAIGKQYFLFDGASFLQRNMNFVRAEIEASPLWERDGRAMIDRWLRTLDRRPMLHHAVLTVFMVSGWSNHYPAAMAALASSDDPSGLA
jgi:hypothetical protein